MNSRELQVPVAAPTPLIQVLEASPQLGPIVKNRATLMVSVNCHVTEFDAQVRNEDEVAFLSPFGYG